MFVAERHDLESHEGLTPHLSEVIPEFLEHLRFEAGRVPYTLLRYRAHLERFVETVGDCRVESINGERLSIYRRALTDRGLSAATIASTLSALRTFLDYARTIRGWSTYDPAKIRRPPIPKREVEYLTKAEVQRFGDAIPLKTLTGLRDRALTETLCATGMRISEALSLNRSDIDWETGEAHIIGKGGKQRRVYFSDAALEWIRRYLAHRHDDEPAVFTAQGLTPRRLAPGDAWRQFQRHSLRAGLSKRVYPHMLRHTMATTLLANGCPIGHIQKMLGHQRLTTTCQYYLGVMSDAEVKAAHRRYLVYRIDPAEGQEREIDMGDKTRVAA